MQRPLSDAGGRWRLGAVALWLELLGTTSSCHRARGTCELDVDCTPGFDCRAGSCTQRAAVPALIPGVTAPFAGSPGAPERALGPITEAPRPAAAAAQPPAPAAASRPARPGQPPERAEPPPSAEPPASAPRAPRLPAWRARLQNT